MNKVVLIYSHCYIAEFTVHRLASVWNVDDGRTDFTFTSYTDIAGQENEEQKIAGKTKTFIRLRLSDSVFSVNRPNDGRNNGQDMTT